MISDLSIKDQIKIGSCQLIVLGMHRSGTSCITNILNLMGAYCGSEQELTGFNEENPKGFWERRDIRNICDYLLHSFGGDWWKVSDFSTDNLSQKIITKAQTDFKLIVEQLNSHQVWVIKEPRLCLLFPILKTCLSNPIIIHVHRNPIEVAKSLRKRNGYSLHFGIALWELYNRYAIYASEELPKVLISYNEIISNPNKAVQKFFYELISLGVTDIKRPNSDLIGQLIDINLYREKNNELVAQYLSSHQLKLYDYLNKAERKEQKLLFNDNKLAVGTCTILQDNEYIIEELLDIRKKYEQLQQINKNLDLVLKGITSSRSWKAANTFEKIYNTFLPPFVQPTIKAFFDITYQSAKSIFNLLTSSKNIDVSFCQINKQNNNYQSTSKLDDYSRFSVEIIICVHNSLDDVKICLSSVEKFRTQKTSLIVVNDGSNKETSQYLNNYFSNKTDDKLIIHQQAKGYTCAANAGLKISSADYIILLNSDTIVPQGWIEKLIETGEANNNIGIVGALSNAASWQSIPKIFDKNTNDWATNTLPQPLTVDMMNQIVELQSNRNFPTVSLINGFCFAIKRKTIEKIGYLDEESFPKGYGEENDYCFRAADAGLSLAIATHCYIYHSKSKSYTHERRRELSKHSNNILIGKYGKKRIEKATKQIKNDLTLDSIRKRVKNLLDYFPLVNNVQNAETPSILFLLPVSGGGGGAHSVMQEANGLRQLGINVKVAVPIKHQIDFHLNYSQEFSINKIVFFYYQEKDLLKQVQDFDIVVATIFTSVRLLKNIVQHNPSIIPAYYAQDYEPLFEKLDNSLRQEALNSYTLIPNITIFSKTQWIAKQIEKNHGVIVNKVQPSLDRKLFNTIGRVDNSKIIKIMAMVRVTTPRRSPHKTIRVLTKLKEKYQGKIEIYIFGSSDSELAENKIETKNLMTNLGILTRYQVAELMKKSDIFIDLSEYQAFGRTGLEAMASGVAVVLPQEGGVRQYARHNLNSIIVDTSDEEYCFKEIEKLIKDHHFLNTIKNNGVSTSINFSVNNAVYSELILFLSIWLNQKLDLK